MDTHSDWFSREEAATYARVSVRTIDYAIASGALPARKCGRRRLIHRRDLDRWLGLIVLLLVVAVSALLLAARAGLEPAVDAVQWLRSEVHGGCRSHHHRGAGRLIVLGGPVEPRARGVRRRRV